MKALCNTDNINQWKRQHGWLLGRLNCVPLRTRDFSLWTLEQPERDFKFFILKGQAIRYFLDTSAACYAANNVIIYTARSIEFSREHFSLTHANRWRCSVTGSVPCGHCVAFSARSLALRHSTSFDITTLIFISVLIMFLMAIMVIT